ncbi:hypothetical protein GGS24DRAFT_501453 [Hypoxylon argillaceum]|nr:hypothetical protein GGS24DRAFT_501453 [Hypoxylon argillaceum]KAI1153425.1 hypothetical protein F4825DRAFT_449498 [Nemania diffusa]
MAKDNIPSVGILDKPESLDDLLKQDRGGGAFIGLAAYSYFSGNAQLERQRAKILASKSMFGMRSRRFGIATTSLGLAWLGIWRLFL